MKQRKNIELLTTTIAAKEMSVSHDTIKRRIESGLLKAMKVGRRYFIERSDFEEFKARHIKAVS